MKIYIADIECDAQTFEAFLLPKECGLFMIRAFSKSGEISIGLTDRGTLVLNEVGSEKVVVIPPYNGQYPFSKLTDEVSEKLFKSNKKEIQNMIQLVSITSDMNEVRLSKVNSSLELYATKAQIETDLVLNNVEIFKEEENADFLSTCMSAVEGDSIVVSNFNERKNAYRIDNDDERQESYCIVQSISS
jgi:hypothetical protein